MLSETMYFSSYVLPFQNLYVIEAFFLTSFPTDVFHAFTKMSGCVLSLTSLIIVMTKCPLGNLFGPWLCLTCDVDKVPTRTCSAIQFYNSFQPNGIQLSYNSQSTIVFFTAHSSFFYSHNQTKQTLSMMGKPLWRRGHL
jgi:hypothetical protein